MQPTILPFHAEHLSLIVLDAHDLMLMGGGIERAKTLSDLGVAFTMVVDGRIVACGGLVETTPGVAVAWMVASQYVKQYRLAVARRAKAILDDLAATRKLRRLETTCHTHEKFSRWMAYMGFEKEGVMRQAGLNAQDIVMYGRLL